MNPYKLQVKLYVEQANGFRLEPFIPVFHDWIKRQALNELLIDVTDYGHVHHGPGVLLVGHGSDYYVDLGEGRPGLLYSRKRDAPAPDERLRDAFRRALTACRLLENEPALSGKLRFVTSEALLRVNDRLLAPNTNATYAELQPELESFARRLYEGADVTLHREGAERDLFTVRVRATGAPGVAALLDRLGGPVG